MVAYMNHESSIDVLYFTRTGDHVYHDWKLGANIALPSSVDELMSTLGNYMDTSSADWMLFWDSEFAPPDIDLVTTLSLKPVDAWHAGLRLGLGGKPDVLNYVQPTWMYNKDASENIEHSSFRLSLRAALIRTAVLKKIFNLASYASVEMAGLALGYKIIKEGGIIRYHPELLKNNIPAESIPAKDEWVFAREFFPLKWQLWAILNHPKPVSNFLTWLNAKAAGKYALRPAVHSSKKVFASIPYATVSVLAPTLNRYSYLLSELEQLSKQTVLPFEVLITDQTDVSDRIALDFSKYPGLSIRYFPQDERGQCIAWNRMLEEAKGEYVLFLGDDADHIKPDFIEKLLLTQQRFNCDMVASNVIEAGITYGPPNEHYYLSDTFPITLIKRDLLLKTGFFDMFFNKNIRADHDLAMRCHLQGALMVFDSSATIFHHRAPVGGLRTHNARAVTSSMVKRSLTKFLNPTSSEIYLAKKYYTPLQVRNYIRIKYFNQLFIKGNIIKKIARVLVFIVSIPSFYKSYKRNEQLADRELMQRKEMLSNNNPVPVN